MIGDRESAWREASEHGDYDRASFNAGWHLAYVQAIRDRWALYAGEVVLVIGCLIIFGLYL